MMTTLASSICRLGLILPLCHCTISAALLIVPYSQHLATKSGMSLAVLKCSPTTSPASCTASR